MTATLEVTDLRKQFSIGRPAIDGVSFGVPAGEIVVLLGPSGCGKTTTLRCVAGLEHPTSGEISIAGRVVSSPARGILVPPRSRDLGMVFQSYAVWPHMTVRQNVVYPLKHRKLSRADARRKVEDLSRLKDEFLSIASHELRTPVTSIKGYTQLAKTLIRENDLGTSEEYLDIATVPLRDSAGNTNLHYVLRLKHAEDFTMGESAKGGYYYSVLASVNVKGADGKLIFKDERKISKNITETQLEELKDKLFGYEGWLPLPSGKYKLEFHLANLLGNTAFHREVEVAVPDPHAASRQLGHDRTHAAMPSHWSECSHRRPHPD